MCTISVSLNQCALHIVSLEFLPAARLQEMIEQILARRYIRFQREFASQPDMARILFRGHEPIARQQQTLHHGAGHYDTMGDFFAQAKDTAIGQGADVYEMRLCGLSKTKTKKRLFSNKYK